MRRLWPQEAAHRSLLFVHRWMPDIVRSIYPTLDGKRLILANDQRDSKYIEPGHCWTSRDWAGGRWNDRFGLRNPDRCSSLN